MGVPDWLSELAPEEDPEDEQDAMHGDASDDMDLMDDLRGQLTFEGEDGASPTVTPSGRSRERGRSGSRSRRSKGGASSLGLYAWQKFILSILLFFNVAIVGLMVLIMLGRIAIF